MIINLNDLYKLRAEAIAKNSISIEAFLNNIIYNLSLHKEITLVLNKDLLESLKEVVQSK